MSKEKYILFKTITYIMMITTIKWHATLSNAFAIGIL